VPAGRQDRPGVIVAEQFVGDAFHVREVLRVGADPAQDAEDRLHEQWRLYQTAIDEMRAAFRSRLPPGRLGIARSGFA